MQFFFKDRQEKQLMLTSSKHQYPDAVLFLHCTKSYITGQGSHLEPIRVERAIEYINAT